MIMYVIRAIITCAMWWIGCKIYHRWIEGRQKLMNKECKDCDYYCGDGCICPSMDKWYACPIESSKPENQQALRELADRR